MFAAAADTHAVIWYLYMDKRFSGHAKGFVDEAIEKGQSIGISSITLVEIIYLTERNRIPSDAYQVLLNELDRVGTMFVEVPVDRQVTSKLRTISRDAIPDMPDRIIAATALHLKVPLISRDGKITVSGIETIW